MAVFVTLTPNAVPERPRVGAASRYGTLTSRLYWMRDGRESLTNRSAWCRRFGRVRPPEQFVTLFKMPNADRLSAFRKLHQRRLGNPWTRF